MKGQGRIENGGTVREASREVSERTCGVLVVGRVEGRATRAWGVEASWSVDAVECRGPGDAGS
jgi:hypothetical protein